MGSHYIEHYFSVTKMIILVATFDSNVVDIVFHHFSEVAIEIVLIAR